MTRTQTQPLPASGGRFIRDGDGALQRDGKQAAAPLSEEASKGVSKGQKTTRKDKA